MNVLNVQERIDLETVYRLPVSEFRADPIGFCGKGPVVVTSRDKPRLLVVPLTDDIDQETLVKRQRAIAQLKLLRKLRSSESVVQELQEIDELRASEGTVAQNIAELDRLYG